MCVVLTYLQCRTELEALRIEAEETQAERIVLENKLDAANNEAASLNKTRDALQAQVQVDFVVIRVSNSLLCAYRPFNIRRLRCKTLCRKYAHAMRPTKNDLDAPNERRHRQITLMHL